MPDLIGSCQCKKWVIHVSLSETPSALNPRVCDCDYCKAHPSAVISTPDMVIELSGDKLNLIADQNGDQLATFHRCKSCGDLLVVDCVIDGQLRGAMNALLLDKKTSFGVQMPIQPRLLSANEKLARWSKLWGRVKVVGVG